MSRATSWFAWSLCALAAALLAAGVALVLIPFAPAGIPIIAASAACLLGWRRP